MFRVLIANENLNARGVWVFKANLSPFRRQLSNNFFVDLETEFRENLKRQKKGEADGPNLRF